MGLGLAVLTAIVLLLPGIAFALRLTKLHSQSKPTPTPFDQTFSPFLILIVTATLVAHGLSIWLWNLTGATPKIEPGLVLPLLAGDLKSDVGAMAVASVTEHAVRLVAYFLGWVILASLLGNGANRLLRHRNRATWYRILRPAPEVGADLVQLTVELKLASDCYLYTGVMRDFEVGADGKLVRVELSEALRRPLHCDDGMRADPMTENGWTPIPGDALVLELADSRSINVDYLFVLDQDTPDDADAEPEGNGEGDTGG